MAELIHHGNGVVKLGHCKDIADDPGRRAPMEAHSASKLQTFQAVTFPRFVPLLAVEDVHSIVLLNHQVVIRHDLLQTSVSSGGQ